MEKARTICELTLLVQIEKCTTKMSMIELKPFNTDSFPRIKYLYGF